MHAPERQRVYGSPLIEELEKERKRVFMAATPYMPPELHGEFFEYSLREYITKFVQMGISRSWNDGIRSVKADLREEAKRMVERSLGVGLPEMEPELWNEEDVKVFNAIKAAEQSPIAKKTSRAR